MPVSPQDFELYSRMTGTPMPSDAMSRMQMAPEVYQFTKNFAKKPNILEKTGNLVKTVGKIGLRGLGEGYKQSQANEQRAISEKLRNMSAQNAVEATAMSDPIKEEEPTAKPSPAQAYIDKINKEIELENVKQANKLEIIAEKRKDKQATPQTTSEKADDLVERVKSRIDDPQEPTTADAYGQPVVPNQTTEGVLDKKMEQGSDMAFENDTVAEVLSETQDSQPSNSIQDIQTEIKGYSAPQEEMVGASATSKRVSSFLDKLGGSGQQKIDPILLAAIEQRDQEEKFSDHPDIIGGEDDSSVPGQLNMEARGMNTGATTDLSAHHKEMRKMDAMERNKKVVDEAVNKFKDMSPSERQIMLGTEGIDSPNEMQGRINAAEESSNKLIDVMRSMKGDPTQDDFVEVSKAGSRAEQKIAAKQRLRGIKTPLTEKLYPSDVARTDIQVGGMVDRKTGLGKSVGISYTPMNGDTKVGFNIMSDPTKPTEVSTFDFIAPPDTMKSLESREEDSLGTKSFGKLFNIARQKKQGFSGIEM